MLLTRKNERIIKIFRGTRGMSLGTSDRIRTGSV
jgi:hypothetical protein